MARIHATCVAVAETGVLIRGPSGSGKSDLALRLIDGGATLVADDYCDLDASGGRLEAHAPAPIAGLIEIRGFGVVRLPFRERVTIGLVIDLCPEAEIERLPERLSAAIEGVTVPWIALDARVPSAVAKTRFMIDALKSGTRVTTESDRT